MSKYKNARDVLPESLIREIQKYVRGEHLYIPQTERTGWGKKSGTRADAEIRRFTVFIWMAYAQRSWRKCIF
jgi:hypothetical protein